MNLDPSCRVGSVGGIRVGSAIDQKGLGRHSGRFEEFGGFQFSESVQKTSGKVSEGFQAPETKAVRHFSHVVSGCDCSGVLRTSGRARTPYPKGPGSYIVYTLALK